jgi:hypothetical protein
MSVEDLNRLLRTGHVEAQGIVDTVTDPMLVLDESLCVRSASRSFFQTFKVDRDETIGKHVYELGNGQWDIPELRVLLMDVIPKSTAVILGTLSLILGAIALVRRPHGRGRPHNDCQYRPDRSGGSSANRGCVAIKHAPSSTS